MEQVKYIFILGLLSMQEIVISVVEKVIFKKQMKPNNCGDSFWEGLAILLMFLTLILAYCML